MLRNPFSHHFDLQIVDLWKLLSILGIIYLFQSMFYDLFLVKHLSLSDSMRSENMLSNMELSKLAANLHLFISVRPWRTFPPFLKHLLKSPQLHMNTHVLTRTKALNILFHQWMYEIFFTSGQSEKKIISCVKHLPFAFIWFYKTFFFFFLQYHQH